MSKFSSFKEHQLITEGWREYTKEAAPLEEIAPISPLSATKPGERIPVPGSQRPLEDRGLDEALKQLTDAISLVDMKYEKLVGSVATRDHNDRQFMPPEVWKVGEAIQQVHLAAERIEGLMGDDPAAPRLEEE